MKSMNTKSPVVGNNRSCRPTIDAVLLQVRIDDALAMLSFMIGAGGKWKERDGEIQSVIRVLEGSTNC